MDSIQVKDFNEILKYFEKFALENFNKENKSINDFTISCTSRNIDYLLGIDIDRKIKMKQLRTMYLDESKLQEIKTFLYTDPSFFKTAKQTFTYEFNQVGGKENSTHHKKGGCLEFITFIIEPFIVEIHTQFRASVVPYNLYFDLILLSELFDELGFKKEPYPPSERYTYYFHFDEIKGKLMQNLFYYISAGYCDNLKEFIDGSDYAKLMIEQYKVANLSNYKSIKRFYGKCNEILYKRGILSNKEDIGNENN